MSLLSDAMETCTIINKIKEDDGYGGYKTTYSNGDEFKAAIVVKNSIEDKIAMRRESEDTYTVTTEKSINLQYHDVFRRNSDGKVLRVTSDGNDKHTPDSATLNMRQVSAEEWTIPT